MKTYYKRKISKFPDFQAAPCARKNAISPKVFTRFSKTFPSAERCGKIGIWARKFHGRSYFSFAMVRWKLLKKENFKFPNSKLQTVKEKMLYHQRYSTDFQKLFFCCKDVSNRYLSRKFHWRSYIRFAMVRWKLLQKENLKFPNSKLHTVPEKMLYHQRCSTDFQKLFCCWKMWKYNWYLSPKISWAQLF